MQYILICCTELNRLAPFCGASWPVSHVQIGVLLSVSMPTCGSATWMRLRIQYPWTLAQAYETLWIQHDLKKSPWMQDNRVLHQTVSPAFRTSDACPLFKTTLMLGSGLPSRSSNPSVTLILPLRRRTKQKIVSAIAKSLAMPGGPTRSHQSCQVWMSQLIDLQLFNQDLFKSWNSVIWSEFMQGNFSF